MALDIAQIKKQQANKQTSDHVSFWKKDITLGKVFNDKRKEEFYSELVILITSGLDFKASLDIIIKEQTNKQLKDLFQSIADKILHGASFSGAIESNKHFSVYEFFSLRIGEESGRLIEVMKELTQYYRKRLKQRKQMTSAFSYPILIFFTAFGAVFFMMNFIVPLFADAFMRFDSELPALTQGVISVSKAFRDYWLLIPLTITGITFAYKTFKNQEWFRKGSSSLLLNIPLFGPLVRKIYMARFCQSMALMTGAKTPLVQALDLVSKMMGLYPFEVALKQIQMDLFHGKLLHASMARFSIFESRMVSLIKVGEETNRLDGIFKRLYEQYSEDTDHQTALMSSMLEPLLIILIGGMVAVILIAMYLPMFKLGNSLMGS
ncbi:type II secretion system F family protein [Carboxylicivirga sediminis]|uniref:Type II secretion system F family protein n=1 Tax=Carboxylicivirga sediminis TaxID=2006564 RepID=A0A941F2W1_9BACT|nr:type II secretion system F family protein [Carboxylicivirga sediminis]MBR8534934.1 type II secretion system F family protein [Carboxylicivirga sediminis]